MISIAICDDEQDQAMYALRCIRTIEQNNEKFNIKIFSNPNILVDEIDKNGNFDIYILDIYMPEMEGTKLAELIRKRNEDCQIIFTTTSKSHAIDAFELNAIDYLVKPFDKEKLVDAVKKAVSLYNLSRLQSIVIKASDGIRKVSIKDIMYVEADKHYQLFYLSNETLVVRSTIASVWKDLSSDIRFIQPHGSFIVNMDYIKVIETDSIKLTNGEIIPIAKPMRAKIKSIYMDYMFTRY